MVLIERQGSNVAVRLLVIEDHWLDSEMDGVCCCESISCVLSVDVRAGYLGRVQAATSAPRTIRPVIYGP